MPPAPSGNSSLGGSLGPGGGREGRREGDGEKGGNTAANRLPDALLRVLLAKYPFLCLSLLGRLSLQLATCCFNGDKGSSPQAGGQDGPGAGVRLQSLPLASPRKNRTKQRESGVFENEMTVAITDPQPSGEENKGGRKDLLAICCCSHKQLRLVSGGEEKRQNWKQFFSVLRETDGRFFFDGNESYGERI